MSTSSRMVRFSTTTSTSSRHGRKGSAPFFSTFFSVLILSSRRRKPRAGPASSRTLLRYRGQSLGNGKRLEKDALRRGRLGRNARGSNEGDGVRLLPRQPAKGVVDGSRVDARLHLLLGEQRHDALRGDIGAVLVRRDGDADFDALLVDFELQVAFHCHERSRALRSAAGSSIDKGISADKGEHRQSDEDHREAQLHLSQVRLEYRGDPFPSSRRGSSPRRRPGAER